MRFVAVLALVSLAACAVSCAEGPYVWVDDLPASALKPSPYKVQLGDKLAINVWNQAPLSGEVIVRPDGNITLPLVGDIYVLGMTPPQVADEVGKHLTGLVVDPHVAVSLANLREPNVSVVGEVKQAGAFPMRPGEGVLELIARAGGLSEFADKGRVFVIRRSEGLRVRFDYSKLAHADGVATKFPLVDGDIIVVE
ncbi:MAG TPA: polysaccharide biosynthesis/export family protein [Myxococcota bacterium]